MYHTRLIMNEVLKVDGLSKFYGENKVLDNISFSVYPNEIVGFIGPNGAGKSTLMKCLSSLINMDEGSVCICGYDLIEQRELALSMQSSLIENPGLFLNMTGRENLDIFAALKNASKNRRIEMESYTRLGENLNKRVSTYSLGMKQRLALAIALLSSPMFLMLDEPMNGLDPSGVFELRNEIRKMVTDQNMSLLVSSHQLNEIEKIADRIIYIENGKIKELDNTQRKITYQIRVQDNFDLEGFTKKSDCIYTFSIANDEELDIYLKKLNVKLLDIKNLSDNILEKTYVDIYGE